MITCDECGEVKEKKKEGWRSLRKHYVNQDGTEGSVVFYWCPKCKLAGAFEKARQKMKGARNGSES